MKQTIRKALALFMTIALVATTITFTAGNTLQAEEQAPPEVSQETSEPAKADAPATTPEPEKSEPVTETQTMNLSQDEPDDEDYEFAPADNEKKNPANEKKDNNKDKKGKKLSGSTPDLYVNVADPKDALPDGASIKLANVNSEGIKSIKGAIQNYYGDDATVTSVQAVDISFVKDNGKSTTPSKSVDVTISGIDISGDNMALFHISGNRAEYVKEVSGTSVSFSAGSFSPYAIASYEEADSDDDDDDDDDQSKSSEVYVNDTTTLEGGEGNNHRWKIEAGDESVAQIIKADDNKAIVKGVTKGIVTITHEYKSKGKEKTETFTVKVLEKQIISATDGEINGKDKVEKYKTISLKLTLKPEGAEAASCIWYSSDESVLTVDSSGKVTGVSVGTATVTAKVTPEKGEPFEVTKDITVTEATSTDSAMFFYLKTPTSDPASNSTDQWGRNIGNGTISTSNLAFDGINAWISSDPGRVISWPDGFSGGNVPRNSGDWNTIYKAYKGTVGDTELSPDDVEAIILHPYKISDNDDGYHVDCTVEIKVKNIYTATYSLWDAGGTGYIWKWAENVRGGETTSPNNAPTSAGINNLPDTKTVNGRKYRLITWHDNAEQNGSAVEFPYTMTENTNFYAKYIADYRVSYELDGGTGSFPKVEKSEGETVSVSPNIPEKAGYNFIGWQYGNAVYKGGDTFTMPAADVELKALWEKQYEVVITADSDTKTYNGKNQSIETFKVNGSDSTRDSTTFEYKGEKYTVVAAASGTGKDVGDYGVNIDSFTIKKGSVNVTAMFNVTTQSGKLTITPKHISVVTQGGSKTYDGTPLEVKGEGAVTVTGIVDGETYGAAATGSQTEVGSSSNTYKLLFGNSFNTFTAKASNYEVVEEDLGRLEVTEYAGKIVVTTTGGTFTYDGEAHGATVSVSTLPTGYTLETAASNDTATHVAERTVTATCNNLVIKNAQGVDVTSRLNIKRVDGSITITPATLTVTTPSDSKVYDGDPLTAAGSITGFVNGESATFATTGTRTEVGNSKNTYSITWDKTAVETDYTISESIGTLTVTENADKIVVTTTGGTFTYDGETHGATVSVSTLPKGYTLETATSNDTVTHVADGTVTANCDTLVIKNAQGVDVTSKLNITYVDGSIKINPATLTITTPDASKVYDGTPLTAAGSINGFVKEETATFATTGMQTEVGNSKNTYSITWDKTAAASDYTISESIGTLTVNEYAGEIVVTTTGGEFTYDGEAHGATVEVTSLPEKGYTLETATSNDTATHVAEGTVTANCDTLVIKNAQGTDVTSNLNIKYVNGSITITPATLTVTTPDATKVYDGTPLTAEGSITGFVNGETAIFKTTGSQTDVDSSKNTYSLKWEGSAVESDYTINEIVGTLTVTENADEIVVTTTGGTFTYDGKAHGATVSVSPLPSGYTLETAESNDKATHVAEGSVTANCDTLVIRNAQGVDVTSNLNIKYVDGSITITPKHVRVATQGGSKTYDGTPLVVNGAEAVTVYGIVEGETYGAAATGSQTEVGSSSNTYKLLLGNGVNSFTAKASNYDVEWNFIDGYKANEESLGTLTVTEYAKEIVVTTTGGTFTYDGKAHGATVSVSTLPNGYTLETATSNDTATHVAEGTVTANCDNLVIKNAQGKNVTGKLNIKYVNGSIKITPATLAVTTETASKVYDGEPLTAGGSIDGFVKEETATFETTGSQTKVDSSKNTYSITWDKTAVESDYTISETIGTLTVTENADEIVVTTTGGTFTYDGKAHGATVTVSTLPKGYKLDTATSDDTATHVADGTVTANCDTIVIKNAQGVDVTSKLNITYVDGSIKINPAILTVITPDASKVYDGDPLTAEGSITGFVNGETAKFTTTGSQTTSGSSKNTYKIDWEHEATTASESNYTISESVGTLKVSEYAGLITVTTTGGTFTYDGEAHGATVEVTGLPEKGYTVETATSNDKATHVAEGTVEAHCDTLVIRNAQGDDVTNKLNIEHVNGNITINPATLTVITQSASKVYDSEPLTAGGSIKGFIEGENAKFTVTGSQTEKGSSENTYKIEWNDENTHASDYSISEQIGILTVTENADEIVVTTTGGTFTYDGKVHRAKVIVSELPKGYTLVEAESTARAKDVTEEPITATADVLKIVNADGLDVTKELKIKYVDGKIKVNPRSITVTSASATKQYDGTPLTANSFVIGGEGMADGESLVILFGDGQTEIGKKDNDFQILGVTATSNLKAASQLEAEDVSQPKLENYDITTVFGTLTVTAAEALPATVENGDNGGNGGNGNNAGTANPDGLVAGDGYNVTTIGNGQTPLANSLLDLNCCILHLLIMLAAMLMLIWYTHDMKKRQRKIFELEEQLNEME